MNARKVTARLLNFLLAGLIGLSAALPARSPADDTDIYLGSKTAIGAIQPNVLFVLDTSSSMNNTDDTDPPITRLDRMKSALHTILDIATNINVGLMRFHKRGGPVLYPVADIDADVCTVEGGCPDYEPSPDPGSDPPPDPNPTPDPDPPPDLSGIQYRTNFVVADDDDGIQSQLGNVILDGVRLHVGPVDLGASGSGTNVSVRIAANDDDAEERVADGAVDLTSSDLEIAHDGSDDQIIGLRFPAVAVPKGATIVSAEIVFEIDELKSGEDGSLDMDVWGESAAGARGPFTTTAKSISSRPRTGAVVSWNDVAVPAVNDKLVTAELSPVVQEIVNGSAWASGQAMVFMLQRDAADTGSGNRTVESLEGEPTAAPELRINYIDSGSTTTYRIGVRYQGVDVPQGSTITYAELDFISGNTDIGPTKLRIYGEDEDTARPFISGWTTDFTKRVWTTAEAVDWNQSTVPALVDWTATDVHHLTPDIKGIVQKIVNRSGWCGGNDMAFFLEVTTSSVGKRSAYSFNEASTLAPVLRLSFDADNPQPGATGCGIGSTVIASPQSSTDDAEESSGGSVDTGSSDLELIDDGGPQTVGIRFPNVGIPQGATIISADITFTVDETNSETTSLTFRGQLSGNAASFTSASNDITSRPKTTASVVWDAASSPAMVAWSNVGDQFTTPSLISIVQEIVNQSAWAYGNSMAIIVNGTGKRVAESQDGSPLDAPKLRVEYQTGAAAAGGSASSASGGASGLTGVTVRDRLHQIVDDIQFRSGTPILGAMVEATRYLRGEPVYYGLQRGPQDNKDAVTRVSHSASWVGGTVIRPDGCSDLNLDADACIKEIIVGDAVYKSPIIASCQETYIILLTDGSGGVSGAESDTPESDPRNYVDALTGTDCGSSHDPCVIDLVSYLHTNDQITSSTQLLQVGTAPLDDDQLVHTYTIGFNAAGETDFLTDVAAAGGGKFFDAASADELAGVFKSIVGDILKRTTSLAAPSLSVNAFNRLFHRNEVYFSLFEPSLDVAWHGNVKKYRLCASTADGCELGDVLDANDVLAIGPDNKIKETAVSLWDTIEDGREIRIGGAGAQLRSAPWGNRIIYTDVNVPDDHPVIPIKLGDPDKVSVANVAVRDAVCADPTVGNAACDDLIEWMLGRDVNDEDDEPSTNTRWGFADPLHSSPVVVAYGGTAAAPVEKIFVGTNDGGVRMINASTGEEEWMFMPKVMLDDQETLFTNPVNPHIYGLDGVPAFRRYDADLDGIIEPADGDYVHMYIGMRRGGRNVYALDVTPTDVLTDPASTIGIEPKFLWRIVGGSNDVNGNYSRLGQTWSRPAVTRISVDNGAGGTMQQAALLFGGGYDPTLDSSFGTSVASPNLGNAIYVVDADTGKLIRWISSDAGANIVVPGMQHSIPSDLAVLDSNGDGLADRIYVGDTGGNVWRVDLGRDLSTSANGATVVGQLASVSTAGVPADERRILYPPDVVQVHDSEYFSGIPARYDLVVVVTGNRADPLDTVVNDQVYAFRDLAVHGMTDVSVPVNIAEDYPQTGAAPLDQADLTDVTDNALQVGDDIAKADALAALRASRGWYLNLTDNGEKALAAPIILGGKLFFTTYLPEATVGSCEANEGGGRLYALDVLSAKAVINFDGIGDDTDLATSDRTYTLGGGIPSAAVPIFQEEGISLLVGTSAGGESVDPELGLPRVKTYWNDETR